MSARKATAAETAVLDRLTRLVAVAIEGLAPPAERTPPATPGLTPDEHSALSAFSERERALLGAILDRLPSGTIVPDLASRSVPVPGTKILDGHERRKQLRARSGHLDQVKRSTSQAAECPLRASASR